MRRRGNDSAVAEHVDVSRASTAMPTITPLPAVAGPEEEDLSCPSSCEQLH
jgi:hypothetical protein